MASRRRALVIAVLLTLLLPVYFDPVADAAPESVSVSVSSPASGTVTITAQSNKLQRVSRIDVYVDSGLAASCSTTPCSFAWDTRRVPNGAHIVWAELVDIQGNVLNSAPAQVVVSNDLTPPTVSLTAPANATGTVAISASATDDSGVIVSIQLYLDGALFGTYPGSSVSQLWDSTTVPDGSHTFQAAASDPAGNVGYSPSTTVSVVNTPPATSTTISGGGITATSGLTASTTSASTTTSSGSSSSTSGTVSADTTPPTVSLTAPSTVSGTTTIQVSASDASGIVSIKLYLDGGLVGTYSTASLSFAWDSTQVANGSHTFQATATDPSGNLGTSALVTVSVSNTTTQPATTSVQLQVTWKPLRIGAGGFLTGIDMSADGSTRVVRADTYGAYVWDPVSTQWKQVVTSSTMPGPDVGVDRNAGVYEIRVAPSLATRLYMAYRGYIYRSDNRGSTWARTAFAQVSMNANDNYRMYGQKMAVDPANPDVVYVGTQQNGMFMTVDGGTTWQSVGAVPLAQTGKAGITGIVFDGSSGTTSGKTNTIYASSYGNGVYRSINAGVSWTPLVGGPQSVVHGKIATDGAYYVTGNDATSVWRYLSSVWTNITPAVDQWDTVITDPFDPTRVIAIRTGGYLDISHDRGATWGGIIWGPGYNYRIATDIPWLAWTKETYMSVGDMLFDPVTPNRLWFAEGIGVWYTDLPVSPLSITFTSQSIGIEQLVANEIIAPPGGNPVIGSWDRPVFYVSNPDVFPSTHGPDNQNSILMGWALDYASSNPSFIAGLFDWGTEKSAYSMDGGQTWTSFPTYPPLNGAIGGDIAASTPDNIVWAPSNNQNPYYTKDRGASWTQISMAGVPTTGETGWGWAYYLNRHIVAADRITSGTFYMYNYLKGLYRSTDGGSTWTLVHLGEIAPFSGFNAKLRAVPGHAGHLFFTSGQQSGAANPEPSASFMRSTDGGVTWSAVANVLEVYAFGFGKEPLGGSYPTIFIAGWVGGVYGIWRSDAAAQSWTQIGDFPLGSLDEVRAIEGDKNVYGTVYIGFNGSGYAYGTKP